MTPRTLLPRPLPRPRIAGCVAAALLAWLVLALGMGDLGPVSRATPAPSTRDALLLVAASPAGPGATAAPVAWHPPVAGAAPDDVLRAFVAPERPWSRGHRGVDLAVQTGAPIQAPAAGRVVFAGVVVDRPVLTLEHADGTRSSLEPVEADVDALEVAALLNLANLPVRRQLDGGFDPAELGLAPPAFVITLNEVVLRFGDTNPITAQRVVQTDTLAALVDNPPSAALDDDYTDLVSKQLIPEGDAIVAIDLPDGRRVEAADDGWRVVLVDQPWVVAGRRLATPPKTLDEAWLAVIEHLRAAGEIEGRFVQGGRSAGARVACRTAAQCSADAAVALAFPLMPPGKLDVPEKWRTSEAQSLVEADIAPCRAGRDGHVRRTRRGARRRSRCAGRRRQGAARFQQEPDRCRRRGSRLADEPL